MEAVRVFNRWLADTVPGLRAQVLADMQAFYESSLTGEGLVARRDIAWRQYGVAASYGFGEAAAYWYEVYELVCRALIYEQEGMWE